LRAVALCAPGVARDRLRRVGGRDEAAVVLRVYLRDDLHRPCSGVVGRRLATVHCPIQVGVLGRDAHRRGADGERDLLLRLAVRVGVDDDRVVPQSVALLQVLGTPVAVGIRGDEQRAAAEVLRDEIGRAVAVAVRRLTAPRLVGFEDQVLRVGRNREQHVVGIGYGVTRGEAAGGLAVTRAPALRGVAEGAFAERGAVRARRALRDGTRRCPATADVALGTADAAAVAGVAA